MNGTEKNLPSIVVNVPDDDSDEEAMKALVTPKTDKNDVSDKLKYLNKLAPDDTPSLSGHR